MPALNMNLINTGETMLDITTGKAALIERRNAANIDPLLFPVNPYVSPGDFAAQYPQPLDTTEVIAMCEEITALQWLQPTEEVQGLKSIAWRELNELAFTSGTTSISFADGDCPDEYRHDGDNSSYDLHNIGIKKSLGLSDIIHSAAVVSMGYGIAALNGPMLQGELLAGNLGASTMPGVVAVGDLKAKEIALGETLLLNGLDNLLINGYHGGNALEFDGIVRQVTSALGSHTNDDTASGTFSATAFDRWMGEACAKPTVLLMAPQTAEEVLSAYFIKGFQGSQIINVTSGDRIVPGFNFAAFVNTAIGRLPIVSDSNVPRTNIGGGSFQSNIYALRMTHNGAKLVYMITQIPIGYQDLTPGCNTISFQIWGKTGVVVKHKCAHGVYTSQFVGKITTTCPVIL